MFFDIFFRDKLPVWFEHPNVHDNSRNYAEASRSKERNKENFFVA